MSPGWCRYVQGQRHLERLVREVGARKLMWGSDSPYGMTAWCTYKQSLDFIRVHCGFLSDHEKDLILGVNMCELFGIEPYCEAEAGPPAGVGNGAGAEAKL